MIMFLNIECLIIKDLEVKLIKVYTSCFCQMLSNQIPVSGSMLKSNVLEVAKHLEIKISKHLIDG